ncbi:hypothetical protein Tco_0404632 [Tanacetum coccineum]
MEAAVKQCSVDRKCCEIQQKKLIENDRLLDKIISQDIVNIVLNSSVVICDYEKKNDDFVVICNKFLELKAELVTKNDVCIELSKWFLNLEQHCISLELKAKDTAISKLKETIHSLRDNANPVRVKQDIDEIETINIELEHNLKAQIQEKVFANAVLKNELRKLKGRNVIDTAVSKPNATTIAPRMFKFDLEPLAPKVLKNKDAHIDYIKHSKEHADTLREIVKNARALSPLDSNLDSACKYVQRIQEVLVYVKDTCLCLTKPSKKLVVVTPKNKDKKVIFADPITSSSNTQNQVDSHKTQDSNQPLLHSTGVICSTGASRSKPTGNKKNNRILQPSSSNKTNKVEDQSRSVKSRTNKKNRVSKTECNANVIHSMLNANSKSICDVNALSKSKPAKRKNKKQIWKPTGKVVQIVLWYLDSECSKHMTGNRSQLTNFVNKFLGTVKFGNDQIAKIMGYDDYQIGNVTISRVYYVEGLGYNLFFVGQFCDSDLKVAFHKHTCFVRNLKGVDLLTGSWGTNLYTLSIDDMMKSSPICLLSKALRLSLGYGTDMVSLELWHH